MVPGASGVSQRLRLYRRVGRHRWSLQTRSNAGGVGRTECDSDSDSSLGGAQCCVRTIRRMREGKGGLAGLAPGSRALAVYGVCALLVVLLLGHPELLEGAEGCEDGAPNPDGEAALGRGGCGQQLHLHRHLRHHLAKPCGQPVGQTRQQRAAAAHHDAPPQLTPHIRVACPNAVRHLPGTGGREWAICGGGWAAGPTAGWWRKEGGSGHTRNGWGRKGVVVRACARPAQGPRASVEHACQGTGGRRSVPGGGKRGAMYRRGGGGARAHHLRKSEHPVWHAASQRLLLCRRRRGGVRRRQQRGREEQLWQVEPLPPKIHRGMIRHLHLPGRGVEWRAFGRCGKGYPAHALLDVPQDSELHVTVVRGVGARERQHLGRLLPGPHAHPSQGVDWPDGDGRFAAGQRREEHLGQRVAAEAGASEGLAQGVAVVDGGGARDAPAHLEHQGGAASGGKGGEHRALGQEERRAAELLKHELGQLLACGGGVEGGLGHQERVLGRRGAQAALEGVVNEGL
eukprot:scaffold24783_cov105-Isochrysis_galbana.AAC.1